MVIKLLNAELSSICHLLALLGAHHILRISGVRVKKGLVENLPVKSPVLIFFTRILHMEVSRGKGKDWSIS
jgi:hypothetical protein